MLLETIDTARDLGRLKTIAGVLIRHGLGDLVRRWGLADTLDRAGHRRVRRFSDPALGPRPG